MQNQLPQETGKTQVIIESHDFVVVDGTKELLRTRDEKYANVVSSAINHLHKLETYLSACQILSRNSDPL